MTKPMNEPLEPRAHLDKFAKKAIVAHAERIFNTMPNKQAVTDQNISGIRANMNTAIELAELFHEILGQRGYDGSIREEIL